MTSVQIQPGQPLDPFAQGDLFDPDTVTWIWSLHDLPQLVRAINAANEVVIDAETTGLDEHATGRDPEWPEAARVVCVALTLPTAVDPTNPRPPTFLVPLSHPQSPLLGHWRAVLRAVVQAIADSGAPVTNQHLKFDLRWFFAHTGIDLSDQFAWDTQTGSHLLDETTSTKLKERAPATFGVERWDDFDLSTPAAAEKVPLIDLGLYAARDTYWTWRLAVLQRTLMAVGDEGDEVDDPETPEDVENYRLGALAVWCAVPQSAALARVEQRGMRLDRDWLEVNDAEFSVEEERLTKVLSDLYEVPEGPGDPSFAPTSHWFARWADCAVESGDLHVAALTPTGRPQWSKAVLVRQARGGSQVAEDLLELRKVTKRREFLASWRGYVTPEGLIHATYNVGKTRTGRLSSSDPNFQQVNKYLKQAFVAAREGYLIAEIDHSQIELRAAAVVANCEPMKQAFRDGQDLHRLIAATITGLDPDLVNADQRQGGKAANFGFLYGQEAAGFREYAETNYGVTFTPEEAVDVRRAFFTQWDGMAQWHERVVRRAVQTGQIVSPIGRVRRVPDIWNDNPSLSGHAERQAINSPVQGFASDIMQIGAASIEGLLPGHSPVPGVYVIGTVHDSLVVEVPADDWQRATGRCMRRMLDVVPILKLLGCHLDVPLAVEANVGTRWGLADVGVIK